jgi:hypothetical protein
MNIYIYMVHICRPIPLPPLHATPKYPDARHDALQICEKGFQYKDELVLRNFTLTSRLTPGSPPLPPPIKNS